MRIVVNDIAASNTGALSILRDFYNYIKRDENRDIETESGLERLEWVFLLSGPYIEERDNIRLITLPGVKGHRKRLDFELRYGGAYIMSLKPDVYFSVQNTLTRGVKCKSVVYVHQPLCFQRVKNFSLFKASEREYAVYQHIIGRLIYSAIKRADRTIVQTEWMRDEAIRRTKVSGEKVVKITPDICIDPIPEVFSGEFSGKRFFYPSGNMLYKNHACLVRAVRLLLQQGIKDFEVILTLTEDELLRICPEAEGLIAENGGNYPGSRADTGIVCAGRLPREEVLSYYRKSVLVFPSYIESFGYPPAEAKAVQGAILASDTPSSLEVLSGYDRAFYFDPFEPKELCELMKDSIEGRIFAEEGLSQDPGDRFEESSWGKVLQVLAD